MDSSPLKIIDVARVTASNPDSSESLTLPLTFFDLVWLKLHPVQRVIFYKLAESTRPFFDSVIVPNLKSSLSSTLSHYLPLTGKLLWDPSELKPRLVCSRNDTVSFTVAESNADLTRLSGNEPFPTTDLYPLVPELQISDESAPAASFQVTLFPKQGFCIAVTVHHAVLDGKTTTNFLKSWAHISKTQTPNPPQDLIPIYDRTVIKSPANMETGMMDGWNSFTTKIYPGTNVKSLKLIPAPEIGSDVTRFTLELTRDDIQTLRERIKRESSSSSKELRLSTFVVTYSYALTCLIRARGGDPNRPVGYGFAVDCRNLVKPPVPPNYFGNCVSAWIDISSTADKFMSEDGFLSAVRSVSDGVEGLDETIALGLPKVFASFSTLPLGTQMVSVAGSTRFGVYGLDFGWGKPEKVVIVSIDQGEAISMSESRDGTGGVEIGFSLKKHEMDILIDLLRTGLKY